MRKFEKGATRDGNEGKLEYARFFDSRVLRTFAEYMHKHRTQADGELRDPDNWKKGIPKDAYIDSLARHFWDLWELHQHGECIRHETKKPVGVVETLCGILFNTFGYLYEVLRGN